jgi:hypothetical protein
LATKTTWEREAGTAIWLILDAAHAGPLLIKKYRNDMMVVIPRREYEQRIVGPDAPKKTDRKFPNKQNM